VVVAVVAGDDRSPVLTDPQAAGSRWKRGAGGKLGGREPVEAGDGMVFVCKWRDENNAINCGEDPRGRPIEAIERRFSH